MSILPISNHIRLGLSMFALPNVPVTDAAYTRVDGQDTVVKTARAGGITAAIDPGSMQQLQKIFGGDVADGDIAIYTEDTLFILDQTDGPDRKQSFVTYSGISYRIMNHADWIAQTGTRVYQGRRHVSQN